MNTSKQNGFTLLEAMVVVAIMGILAAMAIPSFAMSLSKQRTKQAAEDIVNIFSEARAQAALSGKEAKILISNSQHEYKVKYLHRDGSDLSDASYITNQFNINDNINISSNIGAEQTIQPTGRLSAPSNDLFFRICDTRVSGEEGYSVWINVAGVARITQGKFEKPLTNVDCN